MPWKTIILSNSYTISCPNIAIKQRSAFIHTFSLSTNFWYFLILMFNTMTFYRSAQSLSTISHPCCNCVLSVVQVIRTVLTCGHNFKVDITSSRIKLVISYQLYENVSCPYLPSSWPAIPSFVVTSYGPLSLTIPTDTSCSSPPQPRSSFCTPHQAHYFPACSACACRCAKCTDVRARGLLTQFSEPYWSSNLAIQIFWAISLVDMFKCSKPGGLICTDA